MLVIHELQVPRHHLRYSRKNGPPQKGFTALTHKTGLGRALKDSHSKDSVRYRVEHDVCDISSPTHAAGIYCYVWG